VTRSAGASRLTADSFIRTFAFPWPTTISRTPSSPTWCRVASVTAKELVLEYADGDNVGRIKYNRET
jgi:hypothetical protein